MQTGSTLNFSNKKDTVWVLAFPIFGPGLDIHIYQFCKRGDQCLQKRINFGVYRLEQLCPAQIDCIRDN
jgi:hypothetical protein